MATSGSLFPSGSQKPAPQFVTPDAMSTVVVPRRSTWPSTAFEGRAAPSYFVTFGGRGRVSAKCDGTWSFFALVNKTNDTGIHEWFWQEGSRGELGMDAGYHCMFCGFFAGTHEPILVEPDLCECGNHRC